MKWVSSRQQLNQFLSPLAKLFPDLCRMCFSQGLPGSPRGGFRNSGPWRNCLIYSKNTQEQGGLSNLQSQQAKCNMKGKRKQKVSDMPGTLINAGIGELRKVIWCSPLLEVLAEVKHVCSLNRPSVCTYPFHGNEREWRRMKELPGLWSSRKSSSHCLLWCIFCIPNTAWTCLGKRWHLRQLQLHTVVRNGKKSVTKGKSNSTVKPSQSSSFIGHLLYILSVMFEPR